MKQIMMVGFLCLLIVMLVAGCTVVRRDETRIAEAQARTDTARYDYLSAEAQANAAALAAQAQAAAAEAKANASIGVAQANSQTSIVREQEKTERQTAWLQVLPFLLLIVVAGVGGCMVLWYRGKGYIIQVEAQEERRTLMLTGAMPEPVRRACLDYDATAQPDPMIPGAWIVTMAQTGRRVRMLPPPR